MKQKLQFKRGFTLSEILVAIAIISLLTSVTFFSTSGMRAESRDVKRATDVDQLQLALRLYMERYGADVDCNGGVKIDGDTSVVTLAGGASACNDGAQILSFLDSYMGGVPQDPRGPGDDDYFYYFDMHNCAAAGQQPLVFAVNLETNDSNAVEVCGMVSGNDGGYLNTREYGGTINPSQPYVRMVANVQ